MGLFQKIGQTFSKKGITDLSNLGWFNLSSSGGYTSPQTQDEYMRKITDWVYANNRGVSRAVSTIDWKLMQYSKGEVKEIDEHPFLDLLYRPNPSMTKSKFIKLWTGYLLSTGEAPIRLKRKNPNNPKELPTEMWPLNPAEVTVKIGVTADLFEMIVGYEYRHNGKTINLNPWEVIFINDPDLRNIWKGKGVIQAAIKTIDQLDFADTYNINFFRNSARPDAVLYTEQLLSDEQRKRIGEAWRAAYGGLDNAHKTALLEGGVKLDKFQTSAKDMDFVEQQRMGRDKMMSMYGTSKIILGITEDVNRANAEASEYVFSKYTTDPIDDELTEHLEEFLLPVFDQTSSMFLVYGEVIPKNDEILIRKAEVIKDIASLNERRELMGLDQVKGGDIIVINNPDGTQTTIETKSINSFGKYKEKIFKLKNRDIRRKQMARELAKMIRKAKNKKISVTKSVKYKDAREKSTIETYVKEISGKQDNYEANLKPKMVQYYDAQLKEMEDKLSGKKEPTLTAEQILFNKKASVKLGIDLMTPEIEAIILSMGQEAFELLNISKPYSLLAEARRYLSKTPTKTIKSMTNTVYERARNLISEGLEKGLSTQELKQLIRDEYSLIRENSVDNVVRSEVSRATGFAQVDAYKQSGVVEGKEWIVTGDDRTCEECAPMDGKVVGLDDKFSEPDGFKSDSWTNMEQPPLHCRCRCQLIPVLEPIKSIETEKKEEKPKNADELLNEVEKELKRIQEEK